MTKGWRVSFTRRRRLSGNQIEPLGRRLEELAPVLEMQSHPGITERVSRRIDDVAHGDHVEVVAHPLEIGEREGLGLVGLLVHPGLAEEDHRHFERRLLLGLVDRQTRAQAHSESRPARLDGDLHRRGLRRTLLAADVEHVRRGGIGWILPRRSLGL